MNISIKVFDIIHTAEIEDTATAVEFIKKCALLDEAVAILPFWFVKRS